MALEELKALTLDYEQQLIQALNNYKHGAVAQELAQLATIAEHVDSMLDHVYIIVDDVELSQQRQSLIFTVKDLFLQISDFSKIS